MLIVLNNKCNLEKNEFKTYVKKLCKISTINEIVLCPSYIYMDNIKLKRIFLGSQNVSKYSDGSYTGEISAKQLKSVNVDYCIVGHSERRINNNETNEDINLKIKELLKYNIIPILCIGETQEQKSHNKTEDIIKQEIEMCLKDIKQKEKIIIAYEPIWSIGTGNIPLADEIENVMYTIKKLLPKNRIIYGGSVSEDNIENLKAINLIDGYILGNTSLYPEKIKKLVEKLK